MWLLFFRQHLKECIYLSGGENQAFILPSEVKFRADLFLVEMLRTIQNEVHVDGTGEYIYLFSW